MEIIVFSSPGCKLYQNNTLINEKNDIDNEFQYVCHKFIVDNYNQILIKETCNSFIIRLFCNFVTCLTGANYKSSKFIDLQYKMYQKNKKLANFSLMPLFKMRGQININPVNCTDDTLVCVYLINDNEPFDIDIFDGEIKIIYNTRQKINNLKKQG